MPRPDGTWRCPRCADRYTDRDPRRYTIVEVIHIHAGQRTGG